MRSNYRMMPGKASFPGAAIVLLLLLSVLTVVSGCDLNDGKSPLTQVDTQKSAVETSESAQPESAPEAEADTEMEEAVKVVYHADFADPRRFSAMLTSINNMVTTYQNDLAEYDVRIVFIAHGIRFLTDDKLANTPFAEDKAMAERRTDLKGRLMALNEVQGVKLELCNITRTGINLPEEAIYEAADLVQSGVVRIAELQREGFAYLKIE